MSRNSSLLRHLPSLLSLWRGQDAVSFRSSRPLSDRELSAVSASLLALQRGLTGQRRLAGAGYMDSRDYLGAYLLYYWPVSYMQVSFAARNLRGRFGSRALRLLDVGAGPAPASAALCDMFPVESVTLTDSSPLALRLAERLFALDYPSLPVQTVRRDLAAKPWCPEGMKERSYDLVVLSHALNELWAGKTDAVFRRTEAVAALGSLLAPGGVLLLVEPALLETSRTLLGVRDGLLQRGWRVLSPCPAGNAPCPALAAGTAQTCHAEVSWQPVEPAASLARLAGLDRQSVKMSFFALERAETARDEGNGGLLVVSEPMLNKSGRVRYLLCDGRRRIPLSAKKDDAHARSIGFFSLRRYDRLTLKTPEPRGDETHPAYGVGESTEIAVRR